jgi:hypothetical protein
MSSFRRSQPTTRTAEDQAIFNRMDSMGPEWIYEDSDRSDADRMLAYMHDRRRYDLASPAIRIAGASL